MKINDTSITIDRETHKQLTSGTSFQRSTNLVAMLDALTWEMHDEMLKAAGMSEEQRQIEIKNLRKKQADYLRKNPLPMPNFDQDTLDVFFNPKL